MFNNYFQMLYVVAFFRKLRFQVTRRSKINIIKSKNRDIKINYGCGDVDQPGYINVDIRVTKTIDLVGDLSWCKKKLRGICSEVYMSHVLEHYAYPGRAMRKGKGTVPYALHCVFEMLRPGGLIRIAVPDFARLCTLYQNGAIPLYPRISGRLCGEQDYRENLHKCVFDKRFLEYCLVDAGFVHVRDWSPIDLGLVQDSSFDALEGKITSLNLLAEKPICA